MKFVYRVQIKNQCGPATISEAKKVKQICKIPYNGDLCQPNGENRNHPPKIKYL